MCEAGLGALNALYGQKPRQPGSKCPFNVHKELRNNKILRECARQKEKNKRK